jgi:hypothetical protein
MFYLTGGKMILKKFLLVGLVCAFLAPTNVFAATDAEELSAIKNEFGAVLSLKGTARKEINAIANLFAPGSKLAAIDATKASGEYCMLEKVTKHNMIHYASNPEKTHEDIVYYLNPKTSKVELITEDNYIDLYEYCKQKKENIIYLRSPIYCKHSNLALCRKCAGDFEWKNIGLLSGAFIAERMTQLVLRVFHTSGAAVIDVPDEYREILDFSKVESPTKLKLTEDEIKLINGISKTQLNNVFHIDKDGRIVIDKVILNKDIVSAVEKIRGLLTKTIRVKGDPRYTPDVVYNVIMAEYLRHGFIKSIYVEVILSLMYIDEETNLPIRYVDEINWNKVTKLSLRQVGKYYSKLMRFIYEPNKNTLFDFVTGGNKVEVRDLYRRLIV